MDTRSRKILNLALQQNHQYTQGSKDSQILSSLFLPSYENSKGSTAEERQKLLDCSNKIFQQNEEMYADPSDNDMDKSDDSDYVPETSDCGESEDELFPSLRSPSPILPLQDYNAKAVKIDESVSATVDDECSDSASDNQKTEDHSEIQDRIVKTSLKQQENFCFFCETNVLNFARHLRRNHSSEIDVQKIFSLPSKSKERQTLISSIRKKGNYLVNVSDCKKPVKRSKLAEQSDYMPCKYCLGFYRPKQLWRHVKKCKMNQGGTSKYSIKADSQSLLAQHMPVDKNLRETVFPRMLADKISLEAKKDFLICKFGARYLACHRERHLINVCSRKMRELAKLLIEIKKLNPLIKNLYQALQPVHFDLIVKATKEVARFNSTTEIFESPTYALNIQTSLKQCCDIAILSTLKIRSSNTSVTTAEAEANFKTFKQLLEDAWRFEISTRASADLSTKKWNKTSVIPLATDLKKFRNYLIEVAERAVNNLKANETNTLAYKDLMETVFCRLLLLNRKRIGELQRMPLHVYKLAPPEHSYEEFAEAITPAEQILLQKFKRVVVRGKRGRGVPVLFSTDIQNHTEILLDLRDNFVKKPNIYLFPNIDTSNPIVGYKVLDKHAKKSGVKNPAALTSTRLRKHLATLTQVFNMSANEIEQLATFMGHTNDVHKQVYRLPDDVFQTAKISKLLLLMEKGKAGQYKGKTLDEININMDEEVSEESDEENEDPLHQDISETLQTDLNRPVTCPEEITQNSKPKRRILTPWSEEQRNTLKTFFSQHIRDKKAPKKRDIDDLKTKYPQLFENRTWPQIKVHVQNIFMKKLKQ